MTEPVKILGVDDEVDFEALIRLQGLTRTLKTPLVVGGPLVDAVRAGASETAAALASQLLDQGEQPLRGRAAPVRVWSR